MHRRFVPSVAVTVKALRGILSEKPELSTARVDGHAPCCTSPPIGLAIIPGRPRTAMVLFYNSGREGASWRLRAFMTVVAVSRRSGPSWSANHPESRYV